MINRNKSQDKNQTSNGGQPVGNLNVEIGVGTGYLLGWDLITKAFPDKTTTEQNALIGKYQQEINERPYDYANTLLKLHSLALQHQPSKNTKTAHMSHTGKFSDLVARQEKCEG